MQIIILNNLESDIPRLDIYQSMRSKTSENNQNVNTEEY